MVHFHGQYNMNMTPAHSFSFRSFSALITPKKYLRHNPPQCLDTTFVYRCAVLSS